MTFNQIIDALEYCLNQKVIPFLAEVAKAVVTLICLTIKAVAAIFKYINKITGGEEVAAIKQLARNIKSINELNNTKNKNLVDDLPPILIPANIDAALGLNISKYNPAHKFARDDLRSILLENLLDLASYKAPRNKRCRKGFVSLGNRCVLQEIISVIKP